MEMETKIDMGMDKPKHRLVSARNRIYDLNRKPQQAEGRVLRSHEGAGSGETRLETIPTNKGSRFQQPRSVNPTNDFRKAEDQAELPRKQYYHPVTSLTGQVHDQKHPQREHEDLRNENLRLQQLTEALDQNLWQQTRAYEKKIRGLRTERHEVLKELEYSQWSHNESKIGHDTDEKKYMAKIATLNDTIASMEHTHSIEEAQILAANEQITTWRDKWKDLRDKLQKAEQRSENLKTELAALQGKLSSLEPQAQAQEQGFYKVYREAKKVLANDLCHLGLVVAWPRPQTRCMDIYDHWLDSVTNRIQLVLLDAGVPLETAASEQTMVSAKEITSSLKFSLRRIIRDDRVKQALELALRDNDIEQHDSRMLLADLVRARLHDVFESYQRNIVEKCRIVALYYTLEHRRGELRRIHIQGLGNNEPGSEAKRS